MVDEQIATRDIHDVRVLTALRTIPREVFVPDDQQAHAYDDRALPAGLGQTISQPYIVALMTELLHVHPEHRVLEIGTGTGYQTAILASLARQVFSIERLPELSAAAQERLTRLGYNNISYRIADGTLGWPEEAPFDRILVTAAAPNLVPPLLDQLTEDGRLVIPVGDEGLQRLTVVERKPGRIIEHPSIAVRFVKLIGEAGFPG